MAKQKTAMKKGYKSNTVKANQKVREPGTVYAAAFDLSTSTPMEKMQIVRNGVSKVYLEKFKTRFNLDYQNLAKLLAVTRATLINKKKEEKFNVSLSERIVDLEDLYDFGIKVFEDKDKLNRWMITPNKALGGKAPFDLVDNQFGRKEVRNILGRIEYGVYS